MQDKNLKKLTLGSSEQRMRFRCDCGMGLMAPLDSVGESSLCPACNNHVIVPSPTLLELDYSGEKSTPPRVGRPVKEKADVPLKIGLPQKLGGGTVETQLSRKTTNDMAKYLMGGLLVALGVALVLIFPPLILPAAAGLKYWKKG